MRTTKVQQKLKQVEKNKKSKKKKNMLHSTPGFLLKTYEILQSPKFHHIIQWLSNGNSFTIKNIQLMENVILP